MLCPRVRLRCLGPVAGSLMGALLLSACTAYTGGVRETPYRQAGLPDKVKVAYGHDIVWETVGRGQITYECRERANVLEGAAWTFVSPQATLADRAEKSRNPQAGAPVAVAPSLTYAGPPPAFTAPDGTILKARLLEAASTGRDDLPLQLFRVDPPAGDGVFAGIMYVQRLATKGGGAPRTPCARANIGATQAVPYQADYLFWKARLNP